MEAITALLRNCKYLIILTLMVPVGKTLAQDNNVKIGVNVGNPTNTGAANVLIGNGAGHSITSGITNVMIGNSAGVNMTTANYNMFIGNGAGGNTSTGTGNAFIGDGAGYNNSVGENNVGIGRYAGYNLTTGSTNTFIGVAAGPPPGSGNISNAVAIGYNAQVTASNAMVLGGTGANAVKVGIGMSNPSSKLHITEGGLVLGTNAVIQNTDGYLSLGDTQKSSTPTNQSIVGTTTLLLNAFDYTTIGFHDAGNRVDFIRSGDGVIQLGYDGGWGPANIGLPSGVWKSTGSVGVGTTTPEATFHVNGNQNILTTGSGAGFRFRDRDAQPRPDPWVDDWIWYSVGSIARFYRTGLGDIMGVTATGSVGIGTTNPGSYKLAVEGKIGAREVEVKTGNWADFVFKPDYQLRSLSEVASFIQTHQHLPEIPSEAEVKEKGISLGEMNAKLLQKIEELTLYMLAQQKKSEELTVYMLEQQKQIDELRRQQKK